MKRKRRREKEEREAFVGYGGATTIEDTATNAHKRQPRKEGGRHLLLLLLKPRTPKLLD